MKKIIEYILSFWKEMVTNESKKYVIIEQEYKWVVDFFQELGFSNISYFNYGLNQEFIHQERAQKILLSIELSSKRRDWDVVSIRLYQTSNPQVERKWSIWMSCWDEDKLKDEIGITSKAFSEVTGEFANDGEPIYLYPHHSYPIFKEKEYLIANEEKWIVAKNYGELFLEAYRLGSKTVKDIRPVKIEIEMEVYFNGNYRWETHWDVKNGGVITSP